MTFSKIWDRIPLRVFITSLMFLQFTSQAHAHAFEVRYNLPVPLWLYLLASGLTVALSFLIITIGQKISVQQGNEKQKKSFKLPSVFQKVFLSRYFILLLKFISIMVFMTIIISAIHGPQFAGVNFSSIFVWVVWWGGMAYIVALVGNIWEVVNPWKIVFQLIEKFIQWSGWSKQFSLNIPFPPQLSGWPAALLLIAFSWVELAYPNRDIPLTLAWLILTYSVFTWFGMWLFGCKVWLSNGEVFTRIFELFGKFSPLIRIKEQGQYVLHIRAYAAGYKGVAIKNKAQTVFILVLLASLTFDGFSATPLWAELRSWIYFNILDSFGKNGLILTDSLGLLFTVISFSILYFTTCWSISRLVKNGMKTFEIGKSFAMSLVPIALAYHMSHYFTDLVFQSQQIIPLLSDPLARGLNLLGTGDYTPNPDIVGAGLVWVVAVGAVVIGHIVAVWLAHGEAQKIYSSKKDVLKSQILMLILMVAYTMSSLWILAQPVVEHSGN